MEMEANKSVERPEMEVRVETALELAGAEEGAATLERAIGKAKALGRSFDHLEKQLAKAREGVRRYRLAHPGGGGVVQGTQNAECRMQNGNEEAGQNGGFPPSLRPEETRLISAVVEASAMAGALADEMADRADGALEEGLRAAEEMKNAECKMQNDPSAERSMQNGAASALNSSVSTSESRPTGAEGGEHGKGSEESGSKRPHSTGRAAAARDEGRMEEGGWRMMAQAARREIEERVREAMEEREGGRLEHSQAEESRLAAVESRLQRLEERTRINRDI
jgi:hypothetical protein